MHAHTLLLHTFAVLLLCDYGLFSTPSPSPSPSPPPSERNITESMNISTINITTAESTNLINTTSVQTNEDLESSGLNGSYTSDDTETNDSVGEGSENPTESISSTSRPLSTTRTAALIKTGSGNLAVGIIILIFILILIGLLLGVLYFLRKKGRSYSFDLTRVDGPANDYDTPLRSEQQGISYEQTNKDLPVSLDYIQEEKSEEKTMANGCTAEKTEQTPANENDEANVPEENSFSSSSSLTPPLKKVEFNLDLDLIGGESDFSNPTASEADDAAQNENNNAGRGTAEEIFTEVSLDEPRDLV